MKPEQLEIERLRREVTKLKAERDILKKAAADCQGVAMKFGFIAKHRSIWAGGMAMRNAGRLSFGFHARPTRAPSQRVRDDETIGEGARQLHCQRPRL